MAKQKGNIMGFVPPDPKDLPAEERELFERQLKSDAELYGATGTPEDLKKEKKAKSKSNPILNVIDEASGGYAYWAQFDTYEIPMRDGKIGKFHRQEIPEMEFEELQELNFERENGIDLNGKALTVLEHINIKRLFWRKLAEYYIVNSKTGKPMTENERKNAKSHSQMEGILMSNLARSELGASTGPQGKK